MHLVYITEPVWFENVIPSWVQADLHTVITESDNVINQAVVSGIEVLALGKYFPSEIACELLQKSIIQESSLRKKLSAMLHPEAYLSEMMHGISDFIYACDRYMYAMRGLLKSCNPSEVTFVYGDRYRASVVETPRGGWLEYLFLSGECRTCGIRMKVRAHEFMNKRNVTESTRYDRYLSESSACRDVKTSHNNQREMSHEVRENVLFLYTYETCKDDLEELTDPERWKENCGVLTGKLSKYAPESISYDFDFSHTIAVEGELYGKLYRKLKKSVDILLNEFLSANFGKFSSVKELIKDQKKLLLSSYKNCRLITEALKKVISKYNIKYVVLAGYTDTPNTVVASYLAAQGVEVIIRQHGGLSAPHGPDKSTVEGCCYLANSDFYKKNISTSVLECNVVPRKRKCSVSSNKMEDIGRDKYILVVDDLFCDPTNKVLQTKFFNEFVGTMPSEWSIVLRSHPRWPGDLVPGLSKPNVTKENARYKDVMSSLKNVCVLVCPVDTFTTLICDAIMAGVPAIVVAPEGLVNTFNFKPYAFGYPIIVSQPAKLIDIISNIKSKPAYLNNALSELNTWVDAIFGKSAETCETTENNSYSLKQGATGFDVSLTKYIKMLCRTKIKLMINRWQMFWLVRTA